MTWGTGVTAEWYGVTRLCECLPRAPSDYGEPIWRLPAGESSLREAQVQPLRSTTQHTGSSPSNRGCAMEAGVKSLDRWYRVVNEIYCDRNFYRTPESLFNHFVDVSL